MALVALLLGKYCWSLYLFPGAPFGYDAGIYRYLFLKHASGWPPFMLTNLPEWAKAHALGLFAFTSLLLKAGVPVDWMIGWMWNLAPVILACVVAILVGRRSGLPAGVATLGVFLLSTVQYEGFLMIYVKVFVALLWCALAFHFFERRSPWWIVFGMLTIATHQQIGLIFIVSVAASIGVRWSQGDGRGQGEVFRRVCEWIATCGLGALWYLPIWQRSVLDIAPLVVRPAGFGLGLGLGLAGCVVGLFLLRRYRRSLSGNPGMWVPAIVMGLAIVVGQLVVFAPSLARGTADGGAFLSLLTYGLRSFPWIVLGVAGLFLSFRKRMDEPWQWASLVCAAAVLGGMFFYRRFILPLDFFLLPFVVTSLVEGWKRRWLVRVLLIVLILIQGLILVRRMAIIDPHVEAATLQSIANLERSVPAGSNVIVLDTMAPWVLGYLPDSTVAGPGIFDSKSEADWQKLIYGTAEERRAFIASYPRGTFFYASPVFTSYYPPEGQSLLQHPCLKAVEQSGLYTSVCGD